MARARALPGSGSSNARVGASPRDLESRRSGADQRRRRRRRPCCRKGDLAYRWQRARVEHRVDSRLDDAQWQDLRHRVFLGSRGGPRSRPPVGARRSRRLLSLRDTARAMSQENVEIVRAAFDAFSRGNMETFLGLMDPEILVMQPPEVPDGTTRHGHAGVMEAIAAWPEQWDDFQIEIAQIIDAGNRVAVKTHQRARGKGSGVAVEDDIWFVAGFRNGKVAEWRMFGAKSQALEAAGLSE